MENGQVVRETSERYAYYIRCERRKNNKQQCKAPALKGTRVCYKHTQQDMAARRRVEAIARLELPRLRDARSIQVALHKIGQAIVENRIDEDCGGYLLRQVQTVVCMRKPSSRGLSKIKMSSSKLLNV